MTEKAENQTGDANLEQFIADYAIALQGSSAAAKLSSRQVLKLLRSRDRIQAAITNTPHPDEEILAKLVDLDCELKQRANLICAAEQLDQLRQSLEPPASAWWWHLQPLPTPSRAKPFADKFDWLWNVGTVTCLVIATSFMTQTAKAFSTEGFDFLGALTTISQGAGLAVIAGGALTDKGKQVTTQMLDSVKVPPSLHSETIFGASLVLLGAAYGLNQNLDLVGNWYFDQAQRHEQKGEWSQAFKSYQRSLNFAPDDYKTQIAVGFLYERLGNFDRAIEEYKKGSAFGIPEFLNAQGRAMLMGEFQKNNWQGGLDPKIIREAELLLDRADKTTVDFGRRLGETRRNQRLANDIAINQAIAKMATLKFEDPFNQKNQQTLEQIFSRLSPPLKQQAASESSTPLTTASTLGTVRANCFHQKALRLGRLLNSSSVNGIDFVLQEDEELKACAPFRFMASLSTLPDAFLLRNYRFTGYSLSPPFRDGLDIVDIPSLMYFLYYSPFAERSGMGFSKDGDRVFLIQDPKIWSNLANQLSQKIQTGFVRTNADQPMIWRVLMSKDGQIIAYFAYDEFSRERGNFQPFFIQAARDQKVDQKLIAKLKVGENLEFADFKVVVSSNGKILHLLPWQLAYTTAQDMECLTKCQSRSLNPRVRSVFRAYTPDLTNPAELGALRAVVLANAATWEVDYSQGLYYKEPAIFKLKVSSDGQVVGYQAINSVAMQRFGNKLPFSNVTLPPFPQHQRAPYTDFKLTFRGMVSDLTAWKE